METTKVEAQRVIDLLANRIAELETKIAVLEAQKEKLEEELSNLSKS